MNMIGILDRPTSGSYFIDGVNVELADDDDLSTIRNQKVGFVFQTYNLIPKTNAIRNVELPMLYAGVDGVDRRRRAAELLRLVEMEDRAKHLPEELSGGQKQRVAIARAMANDPAIILADEPTGALDSKTGRLVMDIFHKLNKEQHKTIILITHSNELADETDRIIHIHDGLITGIEVNTWNEKSNNYVKGSKREIKLEDEEVKELVLPDDVVDRKTKKRKNKKPYYYNNQKNKSNNKDNNQKQGNKKNKAKGGKNN
jgi:putative ABC transport system ATP-binding protein